ncbi:MAG: penicillin-binding protein 2 [Rickettsiaceae bacterium]|nr:penicillin-binding protein 2 [Rickettsiaceae bacterium]
MRLRIYLVILGFSFVFIVLTVRLVVVSSSGYVNYYKTDTKVVDRFDITDRNYNLLAVNLPGASLYANPRKVLEPELTVKKLRKIIPDLDEKKILAQLKSDKNFVWIKRDITPKEHEKIYNLGLPGFSFEREQKRIYTYGNLLSHVIGYVGRDLQGLSGIEKYFETSLVKKQEQHNNDYFGGGLNLSIDVRVQSILSEEIDKVMKKFSAKGAAGIIVDPNNGEILALVSKPDFDPHHPGKATADQLFNTVTQGVYEMGSGMKSLTMAIGLDTESTSMHDAYDLSYMKVNGFQVKDYHQLKGWHSVPHLFLQSSNVGISQIMLEIGKNNLAEYLRKLGLFDKVKVELSECARPLFQPISRWNDLSLTTMSYGYGISVSPLHFIQSMVPLVNGGTLYPLTLIKRDSTQPLNGTQVLKKKTSDDIKKLLRLVVRKGTGSKADVKGYYVGGKTGTANIAISGKYDKTRRISSFFGIMPASNPRYIMYIIYREPKGISETFGFAGGGWTAAPTTGAVFERIASLYGMENLTEDDPEIQELNNVEYKIQDEI